MLRALLAFLIFLPFAQAVSARAQATDMITAIDFFQAPAEADLSLEAARERFETGPTQRATRRFLSFGISDKAAWVRLSLNNTSGHPLEQRMTAGQIWIGSLDLYQPMEVGAPGDGSSTVRHTHSGDWSPADEHLIPVMGYVFKVTVPPGRSEIFLRAQALDPITMPIELMDVPQMRQRATINHLSSGILYGILLTLIGLTLVLFTIFGKTEALYYSTYIGCFILMNLGYNGYAFAWIYPGSIALQNYSTLFFMVLHGACGLLFVSRFLDLASRKPMLFRILRLYIAAGLLAIMATILTGQHLASAYVAFTYLSTTTLVMILVGVLSLKQMRSARYFVLAVCCSMLGLLATTLSVWGIIPFTFPGYHGAEIGVVFEAVILAAIIVHRIRMLEKDRITSQYLANHDPLTRLLNRHAFENTVLTIIRADMNARKPASLIMMDIDHFKAINDSFGHLTGDLALKHLSGLLQDAARPDDVVARWGGEEMALFLPNTTLTQAVNFAEDLRRSLETSPLQHNGRNVPMTASFGVACRKAGETLVDLYWRVDERLYDAKRRGRNCVDPRPATEPPRPEALPQAV